MEGTADFEGELEGPDLGPRHRGNAASSIIRIPGRAPDLPAANRFAASTAQAAARCNGLAVW